jgi:hypothetical protein
MNLPELELRHWVLLTFLASALFVHLRGRSRFKLVRAMTDFTVLLAPVNVVMYLFSRTPRSVYIDPQHFPELKVLQDNWQVIRDEALRLNDEGYIRAAAGYTDIGFNSFFRTGWKRFYLCWYGKDLASAEALCPQTVKLLRGIGTVKAAMFASLPPGARLVRHRDPYAGSLRYHLGLQTPNDPGCYIEVDGQRLGAQSFAATGGAGAHGFLGFLQDACKQVGIRLGALQQPHGDAFRAAGAHAGQTLEFADQFSNRFRIVRARHEVGVGESSHGM